MNILISSCLLAGALCALCVEVGKLARALHGPRTKRGTEPQEAVRRGAATSADWDRIMQDTSLKKETAPRS